MSHIAALVTLLAAACIAGVSLWVARAARGAVAGGNAPVYRVRKYYAVLLVAVLAAAFGLTVGRAPYDAYAALEPAARVDATGTMWAWQLRRAGDPSAQSLVLPRGQPIEFDVAAGDVTHGFGVYDDQGHLLGQTQAMPGYVNHLRMIFERPGSYHVLCLEYCGVGHHFMFTEFTVR